MTGRDGEDDGFGSFAAFVEARRPALLRSATVAAGDRHLAEDLLQEALTKLALRWDRVRAGNPEGFVRTVMYRDLISWRRRWRREVIERSDRPVAERPTPDLTDASALRLSLGRALDRLTPRQRAVLVLRFLDDLSVHETAEVLRVTEGTVKSQTHAALGRLRASSPELADLMVEEGRR